MEFDINYNASYYRWQSPEQKQSAVHLRAALKHLHLPVHPFLQPQRISSEHDCDASGRLVHTGCHPVWSFFQPQSAGLGRSGSGIRARFQQLDWWLALLMCCSSAANVGGRFSRLLDFCVNSCFLASLISTMSLVRSYIKITNRSKADIVELLI